MTSPTDPASSGPLPTIEQITTQLHDSGLGQLLAKITTTVREPFDTQLRQLEKQLADDALPDAVKDHLRAAIESVKTAQRDANAPVRDRVARALVAIASEYDVPVGFALSQHEQLVQHRPRNGRSTRRRLDYGRLREQVKLLARQAGQGGFTTTAIARRLQITQPQALALCKQMCDQGELRHNGKLRQFSRYLAP